MLDTIAERLAELGSADPLNPPVLQQFLALTLSVDGTFPPWWKDHGFDVKDQEKFDRLCSVAAGALVEDYLRQPKPLHISPALLLDEEVREHIDELLALAVERGELSEREGREAKEDFYTSGNAPDLVESARAGLEDLLTRDVNVAHEAPNQEIPRDEREREIAKAALLQLKTRQLRKLAEEEGIPLLRDPEALAELIVRKRKASRSEIAELVLRYEQPDVERGFVTRLVPLNEAPDLGRARKTLEHLRSRYIRLAVVNWIVFTKVTEAPGTVLFEGEVRNYSISPQRDDESYEIAAAEREIPVFVRLRDHVPWAEVGVRSATDMRRLRAKLELATGVKPDTRLPLGVPSREGVAAQWSETTIRMLHLLELGLRDEHLDFQNFTQAEFSSGEGADAEPQRPAVKAVRLQGQHVMASTEACRHVAAGRSLMAVDLRVRWRPDSAGDSYFASVRIGITADHAFVLTGYGDNPMSVVRGLHQALVERVRKNLQTPIAGPSQLDAIVAAVTDRAIAEGDPEVVDIFGPKLDGAGDINAEALSGTDVADDMYSA